MSKKFIGSLFCGALAAMLSGCYTYQPPAEVFRGDTFTGRAHQATNAMLEGLTELSLERAQQIALINNPDMISAYHAVSAARMRYYQAMGLYSPVIGASFGADWGVSRVTHGVNTSNTATGNSFATNTGVAATWTLFDGLDREFNLLQQQHALSQQQLQEEDVKRLLMRAVAYAYSDIISSVANSGIARQDLVFQQANLAETKLKNDVGAVPLSDVLNFQVNVNQARSNMLTADYNYEVAVYALAVLMGYPDGTLPDQITFPKLASTVDELLLGVDTYLDVALKNRPDLKSYREAVRIVEYDEYRSYSAYSPTLSTYAQLNYNTSLVRTYPRGAVAGTATHTYADTPSFGFGFAADWTLFNGLIRYNKTREAQAQLAVQEFNLATQWLTVVNEVRGAFANYINQVKQAKLYAVTLQLVIKQRDLVQEEYRAGNCELTRLNEAETNLVQAQTDLVTAMVSVYRAKAQLEAAVYGPISTNTVPADPEHPNFMDSINFADVSMDANASLNDVSNVSGLQTVSPTETKEVDAAMSTGTGGTGPANDASGVDTK